MKLPNAASANVRREKITHYLLSSEHPVGRHKARFFKILGFDRSTWEELARSLQRHATEYAVSCVRETAFGNAYVIDGPLETPSGRRPRVRTVWFLESGRDVAEFVTAYPVEKRG